MALGQRFPESSCARRQRNLARRASSAARRAPHWRHLDGLRALGGALFGGDFVVMTLRRTRPRALCARSRSSSSTMKSLASDAGASMRHDGQHTARPGCPAFNRDWLDLQGDFVREVLGAGRGAHSFSSVMAAMRPCPVHYPPLAVTSPPPVTAPGDHCRCPLTGSIQAVATARCGCLNGVCSSCETCR